MKKTGYKKMYYQVVKKSNLVKIKRILKKQGHYDIATIEKIEFNKKDNLPYLCITFDSSEQPVMRYFFLLDGIFIDIDTIAPEWAGIFYLSILIIRQTVHEKLKPFINADSLKDHGLNHLQSIIDHIDQNPDYIEKSIKYNVGNCTIENITESIEFEVSKIFNIEIHALNSDYENGEKNCFLNSGDIFTVFTFHSKDEFIKYKLGSYLSSLNSKYIYKFPEKETEINKYFEEEINKQGEIIFGKNTTQKLVITMTRTISLAQSEGIQFSIDQN